MIFIVVLLARFAFHEIYIKKNREQYNRAANRKRKTEKKTKKNKKSPYPVEGDVERRPGVRREHGLDGGPVGGCVAAEVVERDVDVRAKRERRHRHLRR